MANSELRRTFDTDAEGYAAFRPSYPDALFEDLVSRAALAPDASLLEIGPCTGQATKPLAARGYRITVVELGSSFPAAVARSTLAAYPNVEILTGSFEDSPLPADAFDLIYSATAFHWIQEDIKFSKTHQLLKPAGHLPSFTPNMSPMRKETGSSLRASRSTGSTRRPSRQPTKKRTSACLMEFTGSLRRSMSHSSNRRSSEPFR